LSRKRESLKRKRNLILANEYKSMLFVANNIKKINFSKYKHLEWARSLINENSYTVMKLENQDKTGLEDFIVKLKSGPLVPNEQPYYIVANISMIEKIIREEHDASAHHGINITHQRIEKKYLMVTREMVTSYIKRCRECVNHKESKDVPERPLNPITSKGMMHHIVIDLIDYSNNPAGEFKYIIHAVDHFTSFHYVDAIRAKTAKEVLHFLRRMCSITGVPCILHSDNGSEFRNALVEAFISHNSIMFRHGKPYKPSTQGKVERGNRVLKVAIRKLQAKSNFTKSWYDVLFEATMAINTNVTSTHKKTPYLMVYGQEPAQIHYDCDVDKVPYGDFEDDVEVIDLCEDNNQLDINPDIAEGVHGPPVISMDIPSPLPVAITQFSPIVSTPVASFPPTTSFSSAAISLSSLSASSSSSATSLASIAASSSLTASSSSPITSLTLLPDEIRRVGMMNYKASIVKTKASHDRRHAPIKYHIADIVTVDVPEEYQNKNVAKRFPAIIIGYEVVEDIIYYSIGVKGHAIKGKFTSAQLKRASASTFMDVLGIEDVHSIEKLPANWGKGRFGRYKYVTVQEAYNNYMKQIGGNVLQPPQSSISQDTDLLPLNPEEEKAPTSGSPVSSVHAILQPVPNIPTIIPSQTSICHLCLESFQDLSKFNVCFRCHNPFHLRPDCVCGEIHISGDNGVEYCSRRCFRNTDVYEKEIVAEKGRYYTVLWNNDESSKILKKHMDGYLDHYSIVKSWRNKRSHASTVSEISVLPSLGQDNGVKCCKVCKETLSESQWHTCYGCKAPMHGVIICSKRENIVLDGDENLYCSTECQNTHVKK
jgi:hypothetical protein